MKLPVSSLQSRQVLIEVNGCAFSFYNVGVVLFTAARSVLWDGCIRGGRLISSGVGCGSGGSRTEVLEAGTIVGPMCQYCVLYFTF